MLVGFFNLIDLKFNFKFVLISFEIFIKVGFIGIIVLNFICFGSIVVVVIVVVIVIFIVVVIVIIQLNLDFN